MIASIRLYHAPADSLMPVYGKQHCRVDFCMSFMFATCSRVLLYLWLGGWPPFSPSFFRMMVLTTICTTCSSCHLNHVLILYFRSDLVQTLKDANAKGTFFFSSWNVNIYSLPISLSEYLSLFFSFFNLDGLNCSFFLRIFQSRHGILLIIKICRALYLRHVKRSETGLW